MTSLRDLVKSFKTFLFVRNYSEAYGLSKTGADLLEAVRTIPQEVFETVKLYVNDSVMCQMTPEEELIFTDDFWGTCDAIRFDGTNLFIFDLKTGTSPVHVEQLMIYAAYYCLANHLDPYNIKVELRIYQNVDIHVAIPEPEELHRYMQILEIDDATICRLDGR